MPIEMPVVGIGPLTVNDATVVCGTKNKNSVGVEVNGKKYVLNGTAKTFGNWPQGWSRSDRSAPPGDGSAGRRR
jgi:hypothetical protein